MSAPIGRGERMVLTGYDDVLEIRLEPFSVDALRPEKFISRQITWTALTYAAMDLFGHTVGAMRERLTVSDRPPQRPDPLLG